MKRAPIGIFDSGIGGLTVMKEIVKQMPNESIIYFGDTARMPYGSKSKETIFKYALENALYLLEKKVKLIVIACNTAAAYSLERLNRFFNTPVISVIEPGIQKVIETTRSRHVGILGTQGTIASGIYQKSFKDQFPEGNVTALACPLLAPLIEEKLIFHPATRLILKDYLHPLTQIPIDTLLLACTHYPLLRELIQEEVGPDVHVIDSAATCAQRVLKTLTEQQLLNPQELGAYEYFVSDDPAKFSQTGQEFLGMKLENVHLVPHF